MHTSCTPFSKQRLQMAGSDIGCGSQVGAQTRVLAQAAENGGARIIALAHVKRPDTATHQCLNINAASHNCTMSAVSIFRCTGSAMSIVAATSAHVSILWVHVTGLAFGICTICNSCSDPQLLAGSIALINQINLHVPSRSL